jgi:hypothetical protein
MLSGNADADDQRMDWNHRDEGNQPGGSANDDDARVYSRAIERSRLVMLVSL